jgi:hypothetical protein
MSGRLHRLRAGTRQPLRRAGAGKLEQSTLSARCFMRRISAFCGGSSAGVRRAAQRLLLTRVGIAINGRVCYEAVAEAIGAGSQFGYAAERSGS